MASWVDLLRTGAQPDDIGKAYSDGQARAFANQQARVSAAQKAQQYADQRTYQSKVTGLVDGGDYTRAAATAAAYGDDKAATNFVAIQKNGYDQGAAGAGSFGEVARGIAALPYDQRRAALEAAKPMLRNMGYAPSQVDTFDPTDQNLSAVGGLGYSAHDRTSDMTAAYGAQTDRIEANNPKVVGNSLVTMGGSELYRAPDYVNAPMGNNVYEVPGSSSTGYVGTNAPPYAGGPITAEQFYHTAIKPQESGGEPHGGAGAVGPQTRYGRALGSGQTMPETARAMAAKLGLPWDPALLRAKTPEGLAYQDKLGMAYAQEAIDFAKGDPKLAAMYYYGGPDQSKWGRRTRLYGDEVSSRFQQATGNRPTTNGVRQIQQGVDMVGARAAAKAKAGSGAQQQAADSYDRAIRTAKELLGHKGLNGAVGSALDPSSIGRWNPFTGNPVAGTLPADFMAKLETLKAQVFLPMVQALRGMGALSNAEGEKLADAVGALKNSMSETGFRQSLQVVIGDLESYQKRAASGIKADGTRFDMGAASATGGGSPGPMAIAHLSQNPALAAQFNVKFGAGAAEAILGNR